MFNRREKPLVIMMGQSCLRIPYHIQQQRPDNSVTNITTEISVAFFSLIILMSCGNRDTDVRVPATIPTILSRLGIFYFLS